MIAKISLNDEIGTMLEKTDLMKALKCKTFGAEFAIIIRLTTTTPSNYL